MARSDPQQTVLVDRLRQKVSLLEQRNTQIGLTLQKILLALRPDDAGSVEYDNTASGLSAVTVQEALDEIADMDTNFVDGAKDAFGRLRVSSPVALFDSKTLYDKSALVWDELLESGSGISSLHSSDEAAVTLTGSTNTAGKFTRRTFMRFGYQPGKSQLIFQTFCLRPGGRTTGIRRRVGLFDDDDGLFLYDNSGAVGFVRRSSVTGTPVDTVVLQDDWNRDRMDGTGESGITLDWSKTQILVIDYEWLGVGRVRLGFNVDGVTYYAHEFLNANSLEDVYMSTPNLPMTYQLEQAATSDAGELKCICCSVLSEGGSDDIGRDRASSSGNTAVSATTGGTLYAVRAIRIGAGKKGAIIRPNTVDLIETTGSKNLEWVLLLNPTPASAFSFTDKLDSLVEEAPGGTTLTGGTEIANGFFSSGFRGGGSVRGGAAGGLRPGIAIDGTRDTLVLAVRPLGSGTINAEVHGTLMWQESP